jgi:hypothetical protein
VDTLYRLVGSTRASLLTELLISTNVSIRSSASSDLDSLFGTPLLDVVNEFLKVKVALNVACGDDVDAN